MGAFPAQGLAADTPNCLLRSSYISFTLESLESDGKVNAASRCGQVNLDPSESKYECGEQSLKRHPFESE